MNDSIRIARTMLEILKSPDPSVVEGEDRARGVIGLAYGRRDRPVCFCGNTTFRSCYPDGSPADTVDDDGNFNPLWPETFACERCGLVVDGNTRQVIRDAR